MWTSPGCTLTARQRSGVHFSTGAGRRSGQQDDDPDERASR
jgi:hypothetical protein